MSPISSDKASSNKVSSKSGTDTPSASLLRLHSRDPSKVILAFALYGLVFRVVGALIAYSFGILWLALVQALGGLVYGLVILRHRALRTGTFLGLLGPEWLIWGIAAALAVGARPFFHFHSILVSAGILLLLHEEPLRRRILLFLMPLVVPLPFLAILHATEPQIELPVSTSDIWLFANQLLGVGFLGVVSAIAMLDHARARQLAEQRAEVQTRLVEDLSHELRTPIATVLTAAQGARAVSEVPASVAKYLEWVEQSARAGGRLVERMLDLAALDRGLRPDPKPEPLGPTVRATVDRLRPLAESLSVELCYDAQAEPTQTADAVSLEIVLQNLVTNALDHSPQGGCVEVRLSATDVSVRVDIEDQGDGIAPEDLPRVFDRMWRGDEVRSRDHGRFGLGLSIAQRHALLLGAEIELHSRVGVGSVFSLIFRRGAGRH